MRRKILLLPLLCSQLLADNFVVGNGAYLQNGIALQSSLGYVSSARFGNRLALNPQSVNQAPTFLALPNQNSLEDFDDLNITLNATDVDGDAITYTATSSDTSVATVNIVNNTLQITPNSNASGTITVEVNVTANTQVVTQSFTLTVTSVDDAPVLTTVANPSTVLEDFSDFNITLTSTDIENDTVTYNATSSDTSKATVLVTGDQLVIHGLSNQAGSVTIDINATQENNSSLFDTQSITLTIDAVNDTPSLIETINDISMNEDNGTTSYDINITDIEGDDLNLTIDSNDSSIMIVSPNFSNLINQATYNNQTLDFNLTTVADANGIVKITMTVNDGDKNSTSSFNVTVTAVEDVTPTSAPTDAPTDAPTSAPTDAPTSAPTDAPTSAPTDAPTSAPTDAPTSAPTDAPTSAPTDTPTSAPTDAPTSAPTDAPTDEVIDTSINEPTDAPTDAPTLEPIETADSEKTVLSVTQVDGSVIDSQIIIEENGETLSTLTIKVDGRDAISEISIAIPGANSKIEDDGTTISTAVVTANDGLEIQTQTTLLPTGATQNSFTRDKKETKLNTALVGTKTNIEKSGQIISTTPNITLDTKVVTVVSTISPIGTVEVQFEVEGESQNQMIKTPQYEVGTSLEVQKVDGTLKVKATTTMTKLLQFNN